MLLVWLLVQPWFVSGDDSPFAVPVKPGLGVEYYDNGEIRFAIFLQKVTWQDARRLCQSHDGSLVEYRDDAVPAFIGQALSESAVGFTALWIGGKFIPGTSEGDDGVWEWINASRPIPTKLDHVKEFPMTSSPYWVDRPNLKVEAEMCLATDRNMHHLALIVAGPCDQKKPYICSLPGGEYTNTSIEIKPPVVTSDKIFHLFHGQLTWAEALAQCQEYGMKLAQVTSDEEINAIASRMLRSRPIMENAWISGKVLNGQWTWVSSNEPINVDESKASVSRPFVWFRPNDIIMEGCLLADRHVCDHFLYVEAKCDRRRPFICEEEEEEESEQAFIKINGTKDLFISSFEATWHQAQSYCLACLRGGLLQIVSTPEAVASTLPVLYTAMAVTLQTEIRHIWVGAYLYGRRFKWSMDPKHEPGDDKELKAGVLEGLNAGGNGGRLVYCDADFDLAKELLDHKCLNMDREDQKKFMMYGLSCEYKQHFICEAARGVDQMPNG